MANIDIMNALIRKSALKWEAAFPGSRGVVAFVGFPKPWMPPWRVNPLEMIKDGRTFRDRLWAMRGMT